MMNSLAPLNTKQREYIMRTFNSWFNVCEGGKRGGKNVIQALAFCMNLENHPNKLHLVSGFSVATAKLNVLDCDGYGIKNYFDGRYREGEYNKRDCLYVNTHSGEKVILVSGGGKSGDERLIKGNTYGMAMITEANECSVDFIMEVFDRTLSSGDRKIFHDFNPKGEIHWYYQDILNVHSRKQAENPGYGLNYGHFTIADNMSVTDEQLAKAIDTYDKNTVWYQRDILGLRKQADGLIYPAFANSPDSYIIDAAPPVQHVNIGVDFGGNKSATMFVATGFTRGYKQVIILDEEHRPAATENPETLNRAFVDFCRRIKQKYPMAFYSYCDSAEQILIRGLDVAVKRDNTGIQVVNALKTEITGRIRLVNSLMAQDRFKVMRGCKELITALQVAVWDDKSETEDIRLDNGTYNCDVLDSMEYSVEPVANFLQVLR